MKLTTHSSIPVYTISGSSTARPLPEWLARKRKRSLKQDPEYANRVELLQDFEFEEASSCIRVSEDGDWVVSTGTYKPQIHVHYLPHLSLSFARHTNALNQTFLLLSSDYSKSLHLQTDRSLEFHTPQGCHYTTRIPRYGRDLKYDKRSAEALIPSTGVGAHGHGEVFRLNLELGRFMKGYEVEVGGDDYSTVGGGALQGGINTGSVNCGAVAEESHNLLAFGTSIGTVEFWDPRASSRIGVLSSPRQTTASDAAQEITCVQYDRSGLTLATGSSDGLVYLYDLRSPVPLLKKDQGYGYPIHTITFLAPPTSTSRTAHLSSDPKILSSDKRIIKIWDARDGSPWTSVEPAVDLHSVAWCPDSGMLLTANEGRQQHSFFIPQLGPAPRWCSFLDNMVEEMAEDPNDPNAFSGGRKAGEVYDNFRFVAMPELRALNLDHLVGTTSLLRPYMHGFFVAQQLYEEARLISQPELWQEQRQKSIREKIENERESRIRGSKKAISVKVNKRLADRMLEREEKNERRKAKRALEKGASALKSEAAAEEGDVTSPAEGELEPHAAEDAQGEQRAKDQGLLHDQRFAALFQDEDFAVDDTSHEFRQLNPSTRPTHDDARSRGLTAVEEEEEARRQRRGSDSSSSSAASDESDIHEDANGRMQSSGRPYRSTEDQGVKLSTASYKKSANQLQRQRTGGRQRQQKPRQMQPSMSVSSSRARPNSERGRSFASRAARLGDDDKARQRNAKRGSGGGFGVVGEKAITFEPSTSKGKRPGQASAGDFRRDDDFRGGQKHGGNKDRRSASGNVMRRM